MRTSSMTIHDRVLNLVKGLPEGCRGSNIYMDNLFTTPDVLLELQKWIMGMQGHGDARFLRHLRQEEKVLGKSTGERFQREVIASATFRWMASPHTSGMTAGP